MNGAEKLLRPGRFGKGPWLVMLPNPSYSGTVRLGMPASRASIKDLMRVAPISARTVMGLAQALLRRPTGVDPDYSSGTGERMTAKLVGKVGWEISGRFVFATDVEAAQKRLHRDFTHCINEWASAASVQRRVIPDNVSVEAFIREYGVAAIQSKEIRRKLVAPLLVKKNGYTEYGLAFYLLACELGWRDEGAIYA